MNILSALGSVLAVAAVQSSADMNHDGTVDGGEQSRAIVRALPYIQKLFPGLVELKGRLKTDDGRIEYAERLIALTDEFEQEA